MRHIAALALALAVATPVQADVYNWETVSLSDTTTYVVGRIEFEGDWTDYDHEIICGLNDCDAYRDPTSPVLSFGFGADFISGGQGYTPGYILYTEPRESLGGFENDRLLISNSEIYATNTGTEVRLQSNGAGLWTLVSFGSESGACMEVGYRCEGATGRWVLEQAAVVPLPGTLALLGLGAVVATARRRRAD